MNYLIKISYMYDGFSSWQHESVPIPLYSSIDEAYKQVCILFLKEVSQFSFDEMTLEKIQGHISNQRYYQACQEIAITNIIRFGILTTKNVNLVNEKLNNVECSSGAAFSSCVENISNVGVTCRKCKQANSYATSDAGDGTYICYACR